MSQFFFAVSLALLTFATALLPQSAKADAIDDTAALQRVIDEALLDLHGERWTPDSLTKLDTQRQAFRQQLQSAEAQAIWDQTLPTDPGQQLGNLQARLQHVAALEMLHYQQKGDVQAAREWRSIIKLPKYASSVEGAMALQRLGGEKKHQYEVSRLLAREYLLWQITRAREKSDAFNRLAEEQRATPTLVNARASEIQALSQFPASLLQLALPDFQAKTPDLANFEKVLGAPAAQLPPTIGEWRLALESQYPNLLSPEDIQRRENIVLKLLRLIPMEYQSGVRDGEIVIPIEYREAKTFTIQCQQIINELMPVWRQSKGEALQQHGPKLLDSLGDLERLISKKESQKQIESQIKLVSNTLQDDFGLALKRFGSASDIVAEAALEIRSLLGQSLAAAQAGQWRKAETHRLDAYVNFDLELEARAMPRDPNLALSAEKTFLDGSNGKPGIKAALDSRLSGDELTASYQRSFDAIEETVALLKVGLSPGAATLSAVLIVLREGLEAVVILAALLAGLRGPENAGIRRQVGIGAWLALAASAALFVLSRQLLAGLSKYGETLEAVISIIAVIILLMVTNWVFHKYYWTGWNAKLRELSKAAQRQKGTGFEHLALVGVGFTTIFREGFETTLFMQSLILEAGLPAVLKGLAIGGTAITILGFAVFYIGAKMPYRKMLVYTGMLVVLVLFTFIGSTTRIMQTVGWLPVHPIPGFSLPNWTGVWLGIYPTWEGIIAPFLAFAYVGGAWLWVKLSSLKAQKDTPATVTDSSRPKPVAVR
ncbi:hypothetical protein FEM03_19235 [Phragmitibacter flavus]|uniref:Iron permease n=1 Tax=Phragmitibacter flavus TaxID=2576071 RepID=A0A5R8KA83_9BACT|nr:FTR1 family protein [Phragmitibacter flavus]TLD69233.1 hypothetical protein FEM03_19235 [Phragmitibacter flavus]